VKGFWHSFGTVAAEMGTSGMESGSGSTLFSEQFWSHPPGLNRRPADYETLSGTQIVEYSVDGERSARPLERMAANIEQVSEQVTTDSQWIARSKRRFLSSSCVCSTGEGRENELSSGKS
jgi:hypothetical protein